MGALFYDLPASEDRDTVREKAAVSRSTRMLACSISPVCAANRCDSNVSCQKALATRIRH